MEIPETGVSRRRFLKAVIWLVATCQNLITSVPAFAKAKNPPLNIYFGESGIHNNAVIGALFSENHQEHKRYAQKLRNRLKYKSRLLYRSTDKFKIPFATGLIRYLIKPKQNKLYFCATLRDPQTFSQKTELSPRELINNYYLLHKILIMNNSSEKTPKIINLQIRNKKGPDRTP